MKWLEKALNFGYYPTPSLRVAKNTPTRAYTNIIYRQVTTNFSKSYFPPGVHASGSLLSSTSCSPVVVVVVVFVVVAAPGDQASGWYTPPELACCVDVVLMLLLEVEVALVRVFGLLANASFSRGERF